MLSDQKNLAAEVHCSGEPAGSTCAGSFAARYPKNSPIDFIPCDDDADLPPAAAPPASRPAPSIWRPTSRSSSPAKSFCPFSTSTNRHSSATCEGGWEQGGGEVEWVGAVKEKDPSDGSERRGRPGGKWGQVRRRGRCGEGACLVTRTHLHHTEARVGTVQAMETRREKKASCGA